MIPYHGAPIGGKNAGIVEFFAGRHALISHAYPLQLPVIAEVCQSFVLDNGAFTAWKQGRQIDLNGYFRWVLEWRQHPGFDWALIPDEIRGNEADNDAHIESWKDAGLTLYGVPVWHMHETLGRLERLAEEWRLIAIGSSGKWPNPGTQGWWGRIAEAMKVICDSDGKPKTKLHGLRMLDPMIFQALPLSSADSTNATVNTGALRRFGQYVPASNGLRAAVIASRIEALNSASVWEFESDIKPELELVHS